MDSLYDQEYNLILKGFDISINPLEVENTYSVILQEDGVEVFNEEINYPMPEDATEEIAVFQGVAQAGVDLFESRRETLGQGAGAMTTEAKKIVKKKSMKRSAYLANDRFDDWYMGLKNTPYEQTAYDLLLNHIELTYILRSDTDISQDLRNTLYETEYQLRKLDLERMKMMPAETKIIVIQAMEKSAYLGESDEIRDYLAKFAGSPMEAEAVKLIKTLIETKEGINTQNELKDSRYAEVDEIEQQMEALQMEAIYSNVLEKVPTEGMEAFPTMAGDIAELMEGVQMDESAFPSEPAQILAGKKAFEEVEPVEDRVIELGEFHEGLAVAEVEPPKNKTFNDGDSITLTKEFKVTAWGPSKTYPKGTKGRIDTLYDRSAEFYMVMLIDNKTKRTILTKVPSSIIKKG